MTPENAAFLLEIYTADAAAEASTTRRVLASVPAEHVDYKPDPKCMSALDLVWHIASADVFFLDGFINAAFVPSASGGKRPEEVKTPADVVAWYDANFGPALEKAKAVAAEDAAKPVDFFGMFTLPNVMYLSFMVKHTVHHRGQLSSYLRPMGAKVPSIYGPSGDEQMAAA